MKKIFRLLLPLALAVLVLVSCGGSGDDNNPSGTPSTGDDDSPSTDYGTATVYLPDTDVQIIATDPAGSAAASRLLYTVGTIVDGDSHGAYLSTIYSQNIKNEIIIGYRDEERPATIKAYKALERMDKDSYFDCRIVAYSESGCLAFAYDVNEYTNIQGIGYAIEDFITKYVEGREYLAFGEGIAFSATYDLIALQAELDQVTAAEEWAELEAAAGKDVAEATRTLYSLYTEDIVIWLANLYDPGIGGFYASSSGRDGAEFGPDLQCTVQLMRFVVQSGLVKGISSDWTVFLPEQMQQQMIYFGKSLQDKATGFFYHPQWGKEATDAHLSRRGRDLGWGTSLLQELDSAPPYTTAAGVSGDGITADEYWESLSTDAPKPYSYGGSPVYTLEGISRPSVLTTSISSSASIAVSKVIATAGDDYLSSHRSFMDYLLSKVEPGLHSNPYSTGNEVGSTTSHIGLVSDKLGAYQYQQGDDPHYARFDGMTLKEMTVTVLYENINPQTGLWGDLTAEKPNGTEFRYTNGYMKTIGILTGWGYAYPAEYIPKVANALMAGIMGDEPSTTNICDIYNVWTCVGLLRSNMRHLDDPELRADIEAQVSEILQKSAPAAILNTYEKVKGYKKSDGGFAHNYLRGTASHQGLPVATGANQSDVDGTCIGSTGLTRAMFEALGLLKYKPSMYHEASWMRALEIFFSQGVVIKYSLDNLNTGTPELHDYETELPDSKYVTVTNNGITENVFVQQKLEGKGGVGLYNKVTAGKQLYLDWRTNLSESQANAVVFETELMLTDLTNMASPLELRIYNGTGATTRLYTLYVNAKQRTPGSPVTVAPKSDSNKTVEVAKVGEWFKLSMVCFQATETEPACIKVYINGDERPIIVDELFENTPNPATKIGYARFITMGAFVGKIYLDNTRFVHQRLDYVADAPTHNVPSDSTDPSLPSTPTGSTSTTVNGALTFDGATAFPITGQDGVKIIDNKSDKWLGTLSIEREGDNSFLRITDPYRRDEDMGQLVLLFDRPDYSGTDETFVFECKLRISAMGEILSDTLSLIDITLRNSEGKRVYRTYLGGGKVGLNNVSSGSLAVDGGYGHGDWFTIRIEYTVIGDSAESASFDVKAYVNDTLVSTSNAVSAHEFCNSVSIDKVGLILSVDYAGYLDVDDIKLYQKAKI